MKKVTFASWYADEILQIRANQAIPVIRMGQ